LEASITLKSLAKKFNNDIILADLSLGIESNSNHAIIGQNGAGKSTILKILIGLIEKDAGIAYINGKDISTRETETKMVTGYMPQHIDLDTEMTIFENLMVFGKLYGISSEAAKRHILKFSEVFDFKGDLLEFPTKLSTGTLRLIQFTRAMIHDPEILLLDEPTNGMDPQNKMKVWDILDTIGKNKTILFTTQDFEEVEKYADRISILHHGQIRMDGSLDKLIGVTKGLSKYQIRFADSPPENIIESMKKMPKVLKPEIIGKSLEFYSDQRKDFFEVLRLAIVVGISDIDMSFCKLLDLYLGLIGNGME
jgi:ABC-2 type transport system ATP-binding protein